MDTNLNQDQDASQEEQQAVLATQEYDSSVPQFESPFGPDKEPQSDSTGEAPNDGNSEPGEDSSPSEDLVDMARAYGLNNVDGWSPDQINQALDAIERRAGAYPQQPQQFQQLHPYAQPQQFPPDPQFFQQQQNQPLAQQQQQPYAFGQMPMSNPAQQQPQQWQPPQFEEVKIDRENWDGELASAFDQLQSQNKQVLDAMQQQQQFFQQQQLAQQQAQQAQQYADDLHWVDSLLGDEYSEQIGSPYQRQFAVQELVSDLYMRMSAMPNTPPEMLLKRAIQSRFGAAKQQQDLSNQVTDRHRQTISRPGKRSNPNDHMQHEESGMAVSNLQSLQQTIDKIATG